MSKNEITHSISVIKLLKAIDIKSNPWRDRIFYSLSLGRSAVKEIDQLKRNIVVI